MIHGFTPASDLAHGNGFTAPHGPSGQDAGGSPRRLRSTQDRAKRNPDQWTARSPPKGGGAASCCRLSG
ncbi:hypothetical protein STVIR_8461 [Streptomyces viridochromogenes Tue57]|uniref:Uncharacterized protein n=1 Tax=Streptomyces viridochromogenes Tue57 TaxID=1160705 RepID=L8P2D5_STRVR|nr:hypothetical protein STVIR_8461 [Streptomyces viridochromogenes Tue57]